MLVSEGELVKKGGAAVAMSKIVTDLKPGTKTATKPGEYWTYDGLAKVFTPLRLDRVASQPETNQVYKVTMVGGDVIYLPGAARLLREQNGQETMTVVQAMGDFKTYKQGRVTRVRFKGKKKEPEKYYEEVQNVEKLSGITGEDVPERLPVFDIVGAAYTGRMLVINGFLVG